MKEIYFYEADIDYVKAIQDRDVAMSNRFVAWAWDSASEFIANGKTPILTTQMGLMSLDLIAKGYRIFIKNAGQKQVEICLGKNTWTDKELQLAHNIFKMWQVGAIQGEPQ